jgi:phenylalanine ammonia-lyase
MESTLDSALRLIAAPINQTFYRRRCCRCNTLEYFPVCPRGRSLDDSMANKDAALTAGNKNILKEEWVRGAMAIRINSLLRGHSAVRWEVLERLVGLLNSNAIPIVPLRGSISASGDLSPLSYIAGAVTGHPGIHCFIGPERKTVTSKEALAFCDLQPVEFRAKEVLGLINGTSVSCAAATNVISDTVFLAQMSQVLTAMAVEVSTGSAEPFDPWVAGVTRPHPGQKEVAANIWYLLSL